MTKQELTAKVAEETGVTQAEAKRIISSAFGIIKSTLKDGPVGQEVKIADFGTFKKRTRKERAGVNPSTKESIIIAAKDVVTFKASSSLLA